MLVIVRIYGDIGDFGQFWAAKNKANSNPNKAIPKPILFSPQMLWGLKNRFEKTKPIFERVK